MEADDLYNLGNFFVYIFQVELAHSDESFEEILSMGGDTALTEEQGVLELVDGFGLGLGSVCELEYLFDTLVIRQIITRLISLSRFLSTR